MLLLIDNYDSFTHNLAHYFLALGQKVKIVRNDEISCQDIKKLSPKLLVFSPGPCAPKNAGITLEAVDAFAGCIPMLGVCLGHQAIGQAFGAKVINARHIKHGKTSNVHHNNSTLFKNVDNSFVATRYHSLVLEQTTIPQEFNVTAWCEDGAECDRVASHISEKSEVMAIEHKDLAIFGVQFHPESLLTEFGHTILYNFIKSANK